MHNCFRTGAAALLLLLVAGCFPMGPQVKKQPALAQIQPAEREAVFSRAIISMQRRGWILALSDRAAGVLTTQPTDVGALPCGSITCGARDTLQITIAENGSVIVNLHREFLLPIDPPRWFVPTLERDVRTIEQEQQQILNEIAPAAIAQNVPGRPSPAAAPEPPSAPEPPPRHVAIPGASSEPAPTVKLPPD